MTQRLYESDGMLRDFSARVLTCRPDKDGYAVTLDCTAFFPEGGGQRADTGTLGKARVQHVRMQDGVVVHQTDVPLAPGTRVRGAIDWEQRFLRMQQHTGEHIVSGTLHRLYGVNNVGFHMGGADVTIDVDAPLSRTQIFEAELAVNHVVTADVPVYAWYPPANVLAQIEYRSKKPLDGAVRLVHIPGCDICACCAPHVARTGQIGTIKILDAMHYKGGMRLHLVCAAQAIADYEQKYRAISDIAAALSVKQTQVREAVARMAADNAAKSGQIRALKRALGEQMARTVEPCEGNICLFVPLLDAATARELALAAKQRCGGVCAVFAGEKPPYSYVMTSAHVPLRAYAARFHAALSGRGGGTDEMVQGSVSASEDAIRAFFAG